MSLFTSVMIQAGVYFVVFLITFVVFNFLSKGYLYVYLKVKASRGKKILVRIVSFTGRYYKDGVIDNGLLQFKNKQKNKDSYRIRKSDIYQEMGVNSISVDETLKKVIHTNNDLREGHDTEKTDSLIQRALYKPSMKDNPRELIMMGLIVANCIGTLILIYLMLNAPTIAKTTGVV